MKLEKKEIELLIKLVEVQKQSIGFLRGFRKPTAEEQDENAYYNNLIEKIKSLDSSTFNFNYMSPRNEKDKYSTFDGYSTYP